MEKHIMPSESSLQQGEQLLRAQAELEKSRARYFDLYHLAPIGYLTVSNTGLILEANQRAASLLGMPDAKLVRKRLSNFILPEDAAVYHRRLRQLFRTGEAQACEVRLAPRRDGEDVIWVGLEMALAQDEREQGTVGRVTFIDITERRRTQEALREREERQRLMLDHLSEGVVLADLAGTASYLNPRFTELFGYTLAQVPTLATWWPKAHPEPAYRQQVIAEWNSRLAEVVSAGSEFRPMEVAITCADGTAKTVTVTARVIGDLLFVTFIDLTQRKAAEDAVRASERQYRDLYEGAPVAYFSVGTDGRIRRCNPHAAAMLGTTTENLMGRPVFDLYADTPHGKPKARQTFQRFLAGEPLSGEELQMTRTDGTPIWISLSVAAVRDAAGKVVESRSTAVEITARKEFEAVLAAEVLERTRELQAEMARRESAEALLRDLNAALEQRVLERTAALSASEERYRMLLMLSPDGISVADQSGRILACNKRFAHMHGFPSSEEVIGSRAQELVRPESFATLFDAVASALAKGERTARDIEIEVLRRDGSPLLTEYSIAEVPWPDAPSGVAYVSVVRDITRRKANEAELKRHRRHLEELVEERTRDLQAEVAARQQAAAALRRSEVSLSEAQRLAHVGSWEWDLTSGEIFWSDEIVRIFGLPEGDAATVRRLIWQTLHPDDRGRVEAEYERAWQTGASFDSNYRIVTLQGETRWLHGIAETETDAAGRPCRVRGAVQDITEQKRTVETLDQRVREFSGLQQLSSAISPRLPLEEITGIILDRLIAAANVDMAQLLLLRDGRLQPIGVRTSAGVALPPAQPFGAGECLCGAAVAEGRTVYASDINSDARCTLEWCKTAGLRSAAALPLRGGDAIIGVLALGSAARDGFGGRLTFLETAASQVGARVHNALLLEEIQRRAAGLEEAVSERTRELQTERDRTQAILETLGESVVVTGTDGEVLFANPATLALTGLTRNELLGQPLWLNWTAETLTEMLPEVQLALDAGQPWRGEITAMRVDGSSYAAAVTQTPLHDSEAAGLPVGAAWVQRDITPLREAARLKDQFVSNVSHELRTPISILALSCDNLDAYYDRLGESRRRQILQDIHQQTRLLSSLVDDTLQLARINEGRLREQLGPADLAELARETVERHRPLAERRGVQLDLRAPGAAPILGHPAQLRQILRNLVDNAVKYTPDGGRITCTCGVRRGPVSPPAGLAPQAGESWAVFEVQDTGIGIAPEHFPFLFDRFFRVQPEGDVPGTGLGLPIAQELAQLHGGWISADSTLGQGSTFTLWLPLREEG